MCHLYQKKIYFLLSITWLGAFIPRQPVDILGWAAVDTRHFLLALQLYFQRIANPSEFLFEFVRHVFVHALAARITWPSPGGFMTPALAR